MKLKFLFSGILATATALAGACASASALRIDLIGQPAPLNAASRTIVIQPGTKWVNVTGGEVVKFIVGDKAFAWNFDGADIAGGFDLNQIAPRGILTKRVRAYLAPDPTYID